MENKYTREWERIARIISHYRFPTTASFARHIGLHRGENLYHNKRGNNGISRELAGRISDHFPEVSKAWILTGEGGMFPSAHSVTDPPEADNRPADKINEHRIRIVISLEEES